MTLSLNGEVLGTVTLVNNSEVELSRIEYMKQQIAEIFSRGWVIAIIVLVLAFLTLYIILVLRYRRLRQRHLRERRRMEQRRRMELGADVCRKSAASPDLFRGPLRPL